MEQLVRPLSIVRPTQGPCVERLRLSVTDDVSWAYVRFDVALAFQHFALDEPASARHFHAPASTGAQLFTSAVAVGPQPSRSPQKNILCSSPTNILLRMLRFRLEQRRGRPRPVITADCVPTFCIQQHRPVCFRSQHKQYARPNYGKL